MKFDMHFHSKISDGLNTPEEIIEFAKKQGIVFLNFTDHDVPTSQKILNIAGENKIKTFPSTEISAKDYDLDKSFHLTYYAQNISSDVENILSHTRQQRKEMIWSQIKKLLKKGFIGNIEDFYTYFEKKGRNLETLNKYDIAEYLYTYEENRKQVKEQLGKEIDLVSFYRIYLKEDGDYYPEYGNRIEEYEPSVELCGEMARSNNAILSIAHPHYSFSRIGKNRFQELVPHYVDMGVNAIEIHSKTPKSWVALIYELKEKYNLLLTAGSDNHGLGCQDDKHSLLGDLNPLLGEVELSVIKNSYIDFLEK